MTELRIDGNATEEEVAAILALVTTLGNENVEEASPHAVNLWAAKGRMTRPSVRPGPGAWRASTMPR